MNSGPNPKEEQERALQWEVNNRTSSNRALDPGGLCTYSHSANGGCAVGRLLPEHQARGLVGSIEGYALNLFPANVSCMGVHFLGELQRLHDTGANWCQTGLSASGLSAARHIAKQFNLTIDFSKYESEPKD